MPQNQQNFPVFDEIENQLHPRASTSRHQWRLHPPSAELLREGDLCGGEFPHDPAVVVVDPVVTHEPRLHALRVQQRAANTGDAIQRSSNHCAATVKIFATVPRHSQ